MDRVKEALFNILGVGYAQFVLDLFAVREAWYRSARRGAGHVVFVDNDRWRFGNTQNLAITRWPSARVLRTNASVYCSVPVLSRSSISMSRRRKLGVVGRRAGCHRGQNPAHLTRNGIVCLRWDPAEREMWREISTISRARVWQDAAVSSSARETWTTRAATRKSIVFVAVSKSVGSIPAPHVFVVTSLRPAPHGPVRAASDLMTGCKPKCRSVWPGVTAAVRRPCRDARK